MAMPRPVNQGANKVTGQIVLPRPRPMPGGFIQPPFVP